MTRLFLIASVLMLGEPYLWSAQADEGGAGTAALCPAINFTGYSLGADNLHVTEKLWWDAASKSYGIQGPELARRFLYPDEKRPLSELKSDPAYVFKLPVDRKFTRSDQEDYCRPKIDVSLECQLSAVPGSQSEPALMFHADYYDECDHKPVSVLIRLRKLKVGDRTGIELSFYNSFRQVYDSGMDVFEGENVFNMGYRLR